MFGLGIKFLKVMHGGNSFDSPKVYQKFKRLKILLKMKKCNLNEIERQKNSYENLKDLKCQNYKNVLESFCGFKKNLL